MGEKVENKHRRLLLGLLGKKIEKTTQGGRNRYNITNQRKGKKKRALCDMSGVQGKRKNKTERGDREGGRNS